MVVADSGPFVLSDKDVKVVHICSKITRQIPQICELSGCYDRGGFPGDALDRVRKYGVNAQELVTTSSTRLLMTT